MKRSALSLSRLSAGGAVVGGIAFLFSLAWTGPIGGIESVAVRMFTMMLLILSALIVALPAWRWWTVAARIMAIVLLLVACAGVAIPNGPTSTGLLAALTLVALSCATATLPATAGRWPAALSSSAVLGLTLYAVLAPVAPQFDIRTADRFAAIAEIPAITLAAAAFALLARAWTDAPTRTLRMPRWAGFAVAAVLISLSFSAWHLLVTQARVAIEEQTASSERALGYFFRSDFNKMINSFVQFGEVIGTPASFNDPLSTERAKLFTRDYPGLIALEWAEPDGDIGWESNVADLASPGVAGFAPKNIREEVIERARSTGQIAMTGPVMVDAHEATLLAAVPPSGEGCFLAVISIERTMASVAPIFTDSFDIELYYQGKLLYERGGLEGPSIPTPGRPLAIGSDQVTLKLEPSSFLRLNERTFLPNLLLAAMITVSILLGLTAFFAQTSADRANISARARSQLEQLIAGARQVAVVATDRAGIITIFNYGAERLSGWSAKDVLQIQDATCLFDPEELKEIRPSTPVQNAFATLATLANEQRAQERDWTWKRPDGGQRRVNLAANPWRDANGELVGYLFVAVDVTEREAAMRALDHARKIADRASNMKSSFLANVSHEIRTPMTAILGCADLLLDSETNPTERTEFAQTIRRNGQHLLGVLNDILDISKIEAGRLRIEMLEVRLTEIIEEVIQLMRLRARERAIDLTVICEGSETDCLVRTDPLRVRQILVNLIGNAIKFTERGSVTVLLRAHTEGNSLVAEIEVRDTGIGLSPDQIKVLFQSFEQADSSTARRFGGTGLGLAISQRLARMLDGTIAVRSTVGKGSSFTFCFQAPLASNYVEQVNADTAAPHAVIRLDGRRILLVDDSIDNQRLVSTILRRAGAEVEVADDGRGALKAVALGGSQSAFDVLLLDMQMPELDGYATARELRSSGYRGRIVALTGNSAEDDRDRCIAAGCDDYSVKPVVREKLLALCAQQPLANS